MRRLRAKALIGVSTLALTAAGVAGAYSYGQNYYVHRGFATLVQLPRAGTGRLLRVSFFSRALNRQASYLAYLPPGYDPARRYPVYYLLHGMPGRPQVFIDIANMDVRLDNQLSLGHVAPMILVYPDGRIGGSTYSDSEWANTAAGSFEAFVMEVVHNVDRHFSTLRDRQDRVIGGFSAGGYGAINIALHQLSTFASVQVWSGYFTQTRSGVFTGATAAALRYNSPIDYVARVSSTIAKQGLRVNMFGGRGDESSRQIVPMARALQAGGAGVQYAVYPGGHDWSVWYPRLNQMLILASGAFTHAPPRIAAAPRHKLRTRPQARARRFEGGRRRTRSRQLRVQPLRAHAIGSGPLRRRPARRGLVLIGALLLALVSAAMINLGFVLQHRGLIRARESSGGSFMAALRSRAWVSGQALGWIGFGAQIVAVAIAPLSLIQAFAAGSLAITVPLAARAFGYRVGLVQLLAVLVIAVSLLSLPIGFSHRHDHLHSGALIGAALLISLAALALASRPRASTRAIAAGLCYGVADAAIKADSLALRIHGGGALLSGWTVLAGLATFGGFVCFQAALRDEPAVNTISLMTAFTALAALALGVFAFGESLGTSTAAAVMHLAAIALVLACVAPLARVQQQLADAGGHPPEPHPGRTTGAPLATLGGDTRQDAGSDRVPAATRAIRALFVLAGAVAGAAALLVCALAGVGLLYGLRGLHWFTIGPSIPDSLPLLQLAGFDGQPLVRVIAAWLPAGIILGLALVRIAPPTRLIAAALLGAVVILFASDASYALARNLRLAPVLVDRAPGAGAWLEALLLAAGAALPGSIGRLRQLGAPIKARRPRLTLPLVPSR